MKVLGTFLNEYGERFWVGVSKKWKVYFKSNDPLFHGQYWRKIDLSTSTFSNKELCAINDIIYGRFKD